MRDILRETEERRKRDAERYAQLDKDLCMLCDAYGADKRSLFISCWYDISEVIPEAIDLFNCGPAVSGRGWYVRTCKCCRARLLEHLKRWGIECTLLRGLDKDHDGYLLEDNEKAGIPVRVHGAIKMMTEEEYAAYKKISQ